MLSGKPDRRVWMQSSAGTVLGAVATGLYGNKLLSGAGRVHEGIATMPTHSVVPVIGDGVWIWRDPPEETGQLEPRDYEVRIGIQATGRIQSGNLIAATVVPVQFPEQQILEAKMVKQGCDAVYQPLGDTAAQLMIAAPRIVDGQTVGAEAVFRIRLTKSHFGFSRDRFPDQQKPGKLIQKNWLSSSPGIETRLPELQKISVALGAGYKHPWDLASVIHEWVHTEIKGVPMPYTGIREALKTRRGDCEERAGVFVALCRVSGIPARLVWVPNHAWAEILLVDHDGEEHWIPVHTAGYSWFGWTGAHELVLQKGDRIHQTGRDKDVRLVEDWWRCEGNKPDLKFTASVRPLASDPDADPGPGEREKNVNGQWCLAGDNAAQKLMRS